MVNREEEGKGGELVIESLRLNCPLIQGRYRRIYWLVAVDQLRMEKPIPLYGYSRMIFDLGIDL